MIIVYFEINLQPLNMIDFMNVYDPRSFCSYLSSIEKGLKNSGLIGDLASVMLVFFIPVELPGHLEAGRYVGR